MEEENLMEKDSFVISKKGYEEMKKRLEYLKTEKRKEISEKIKHAIEFGDLSENAEYDEAKNEQAFLESEIANLEAELKYATIIDEDNIDAGKVNIGCSVVVKNLNSNKKHTFFITGRLESDPLSGKISWKSPVGSALMGHKIGDTVEAKTPKGIVKYKILKIKKG